LSSEHVYAALKIKQYRKNTVQRRK